MAARSEPKASGGKYINPAILRNFAKRKYNFRKIAQVLSVVRKEPRRSGGGDFYKWLLGLGITPHKSKTLANLKIPNKYFFDFLSGHFDGDGCCFSYWDKRWHSSFMFYITFVSASKKHINWLREKIKTLAHINGYLSKAEGKNYCQLRYVKSESKVLIFKMYYKKKTTVFAPETKKIQKI